jgi:hypothetical protein
MKPDDPVQETNPAIQFPVTLKSPNGDMVLVRLHSEDDPDGLIHSLNMEKLNTGETLSQLLGSIPEISAAIALNQSFRIVMPAGVLGKLMPLVKDPALSGLTTTSIIGSSGQIIGTAGLASMSGFVAPLIIWTILSFLTGQFFLSQIQRNTQAIFDELRNILYFLVAKEESDLRARIEFLEYVSMNFTALSQNTEMRLCTLTNLQKVNIESLSGIKFWVFNIAKELEDISDTINLVKENKNRKENIDKVINLVGETRRNINRAIASWQCYALGSTLEIQLGSIFEGSLLAYTKTSLSDQSTGLKSVLVKAENIWNDFKNISHFNESPKFKAGQIHAVGVEIAEFIKRIDHSINSTEKYINSVQILEGKGTTLLYYNNAFYRPVQTGVTS